MANNMDGFMVMTIKEDEEGAVAYIIIEKWINAKKLWVVDQVDIIDDNKVVTHIYLVYGNQKYLKALAYLRA